MLSARVQVQQDKTNTKTNTKTVAIELKEILSYSVEIYATLLGRTGRRAAATGGQMGQEVFSSVRYTVYQHLEVLLERHG